MANAGDSRAVLCRNKHALALTSDHKPELEEEMSRILSAGGIVVNGRVDGVLSLSRAIGDFRFKDKKNLPPSKQKVCCDPDVREFTLDKETDDFMVIGMYWFGWII